MIRVLLADDQTLVRAGFKALLDARDDLEVVGEAGDGAETVTLVKALLPDVVLMDIRMPGPLDGLAATKVITSDERLSRVRVIILTTFDLDEHIFEACATAPADASVRTTTRPFGSATLDTSKESWTADPNRRAREPKKETPHGAAIAVRPKGRARHEGVGRRT